LLKHAPFGVDLKLPDLVVEFIDQRRRNRMSEENSHPTLQGHPGLPSRGLCQKSAFAQPINDSGRGAAIPEECKTGQKSKIARCKSRSTQERDFDRPSISAPHSSGSVSHPQVLFGRQVANLTRFMASQLRCWQAGICDAVTANRFRSRHASYVKGIEPTFTAPLATRSRKSCTCRAGSQCAR
jgi:hypothetical protein